MWAAVPFRDTKKDRVPLYPLLKRMKFSGTDLQTEMAYRNMSWKGCDGNSTHAIKRETGDEFVLYFERKNSPAFVAVGALRLLYQARSHGTGAEKRRI